MMNRDIKFRVWDLQLNKYRNPGTMQMSCTGRLFLLVPNGNNFDVARIEDFVLEQFTGLKDKNGVEIYEGDIIEKHFEKFEIIWNDSAWQLTKINDYYKQQFYIAYLFDYKKSEIVGNIYENPELLATI